MNAMTMTMRASWWLVLLYACSFARPLEVRILLPVLVGPAESRTDIITLIGESTSPQQNGAESQTEIKQSADLSKQATEYLKQGRYSEAEPLFKRALAINEKALGPDHPGTTQGLNNLAVLYRTQGRYGEAEPLYRRALAIHEKALGPNHPDTAQSLNNLALLCNLQGKYAEAELFLRRALAIKEKVLGADHLSTANSLNSLAEFYRTCGSRATIQTCSRY
jgi:tetratricopeptide (TPR) repeat protein